MNTTPTEPPRLLCRFVRGWAALTTPDSAAALGHRAKCPACRAYFESHAAFETRLRQDARAQPPAVPDGLEQRIADAVRRSQAAARTPPRRAFPLWAVGLTTTAALVAVVVTLNRSPRPEKTSAEVDPAEIAAVFKAVTALPAQLDRLLPAPGSRTAADDPLRHELDNVKADARSALDFLAANFLPTHPEPTSSLQDRSSAPQDS